MPKPISKTTKTVRRRGRAAAPSLPYEDWLIENLKDRKEAAADLEAAIEDGDQAVRQRETWLIGSPRFAGSMVDESGC